MRPERRCLPVPVRVYWYSSSRRSTRALVSAATSGRPLTTFDTVGKETPASAAMTASVVRPVFRFGDPPSLLIRGTEGTVAPPSGACSLLNGTRTLPTFPRNNFDNGIVNYTDVFAR